MIHEIKISKYASLKIGIQYSTTYPIRGLFGGDFNLAVWQLFIGLPNLNHAVLTRTHEMN